MGQANSSFAVPNLIKFRLTKSSLTNREQPTSGPTKSKFIKFKLTKSKTNKPKSAVSELLKSKSKKSKSTKSKPTKPPNTLRPAESPLSRPPIKNEILPWRISGHSGVKFFIRKLYRGPSVWHQYGWKKCNDDNNHRGCKDKDPTILFTCKMTPKQSRHLNNIDKSCRNVVMAFVEHRNEMSCGCNLEYITKGTTQKSSNICETRDRVVHKAIKKHDKICACGAFEFVQQEEEKRKPRKTALHTEAKKTCHAPRAPKTPTSSKTPTLPQTLPYPKIPGQPSKHPLEHLKRPIDGFSDDDYKENIFKGMKRKW